MKYTETVYFILTNKTLSDEEMKKQSIAFLKSLKLDPSPSLWCRIDLPHPNFESIMEQIKDFCSKDGWHSCFDYARKYESVNSDWFRIVSTDPHEGFFADSVKIKDEEGDEMELRRIRSYYQPNPIFFGFKHDLYVPERFYKACIKHNFPGISFTPVEDVGRYDGEQYFIMHIDFQIPHLILESNETYAAIKKNPGFIGGVFPYLTSIFDETRWSQFSPGVMENELPSSGFAYSYKSHGHLPGGCTGGHFLIHKDIAKILLEEGAVSSVHLSPEIVFDSSPPQMELVSTTKAQKPNKEFVSEAFEIYENIKQNPRPKRDVKEKDALQLFRRAKREEDDKTLLNKGIKRALIPEVEFSPYSSLIPYYLVSDGCYLSDEYRLLSYNEALLENEAFHKEMADETIPFELGTVIAKCADGDTMLLNNDNSVVRFGYDSFEITQTFPHIHQFIFDAVCDRD